MSEQNTLTLIAILTADWHFVHNNWRHRPEINGDAWTSLAQVKYCEHAFGIPLIGAGDLLDSARPPSVIVGGLREVLSEYRTVSHGLYINGNHDKVKPSWINVLYGDAEYHDRSRWEGWHDLTKNPGRIQFGSPSYTVGIEKGVAQFKPKWTQECPAWTEPTDQWCAYGIDYVETSDLLQEKLDELEPNIRQDTKNLLVLHQGVEGLLPKMAVELFDGMIPDGIDIVLCGHTHIAKVLEITTKSGRSIPLVSPGSLHLCSIDEDPRKKLYFLCNDGSVWSIPLVTRRVISVNFSGSTESEIRETAVKVIASLNRKEKPATAKLREKINVPLLRVVYDTSTAPKVRSIFETALRNAGATAHLFYKNNAEKISNSLNTVVQDGMDTSFIHSGFDYAKAAFQKLEKDKKVRQIVENLLDRQPSQENYDTLKEDFINATVRR